MARTLRWPTLLSVGLAAAYVSAPLMGQDLAAQLAHADFARAAAATPVDLRWFGGTLPFGYTLWTSPIMAAVGARLTGAVATVVSTALLTALFQRTGARRPVLGGIAGAVCLGADMAEGRVTFACGVAFGLAALLLLGRPILAAVSALIGSAASPVLALLLLLCAGTLLIRRRVRDAVMLAGPAVVALALTSVLFADGGHEPFGSPSLRSALIATAACGLVARHRMIAVGALLGEVMLIIAFTVPTPVGSNAIRLSLLFALPVAVAYAAWRPSLSLVAVALTIWPQQRLNLPTLRHIGDPETTASYYQPLTAELVQRGLSGRVETPDSIDHWDAYYLPRHHVLLARGWLRQVDIEVNPEFYARGGLTESTYRAFLDRSAVQYVAVSDARLSAWGQRERTLVGQGLPYLHEVWNDQHWRLYEVEQPTAIGGDATATTVTVTTAAPVLVRIRWSRWLSVSPGACLVEQDGAVQLRPQRPGRYVVSSGLTGPHRHC